MNYPELLPNGPYGPEFGSFGQVVRNVEVYWLQSTAHKIFGDRDNVGGTVSRTRCRGGYSGRFAMRL